METQDSYTSIIALFITLYGYSASRLHGLETNSVEFLPCSSINTMINITSYLIKYHATCRNLQSCWTPCIFKPRVQPLQNICFMFCYQHFLSGYNCWEFVSDCDLFEPSLNKMFASAWRLDVNTLVTAVFSKQRFLLEGRNVSCKVEETVVTAILGAVAFWLIFLEVVKVIIRLVVFVVA